MAVEAAIGGALNLTFGVAGAAWKGQMLALQREGALLMKRPRCILEAGGIMAIAALGA